MTTYIMDEKGKVRRATRKDKEPLCKVRPVKSDTNNEIPLTPVKPCEICKKPADVNTGEPMNGCDNFHRVGAFLTFYSWSNRGGADLCKSCAVELVEKLLNQIKT